MPKGGQLPLGFFEIGESIPNSLVRCCQRTNLLFFEKSSLYVRTTIVQLFSFVGIFKIHQVNVRLKLI